MKSLILVLSLLASQAFAQKLDRPYKNLVHPTKDMTLFSQEQQSIPRKSDVNAMMRTVTSVKNQDNRGTCSIFSATALVEALMVQTGRAGIGVDMSEEWLQYLTTLQSGEEGSDSPTNFNLLKLYGIPTEAQMPYIGSAWTSKYQGWGIRRCGHLPRGIALRACLISHRDPNLMNKTDSELLDHTHFLYDPEFVAARASAVFYRDQLFDPANTEGGLVTSVNEIHRLLAAGIPMTMEFDFYYGAWNHPEAKKWGINRSPRLWRQGAVTYPEKGSTDLAYSKRSPAGHSVLVVGYDNEREISYWVRMKDGTKKKVTRKGVYYFKNSWGLPEPGGWGSEFEIDGVRYPGYGMMLQDHAHDHGQFFRLVLK